MITLDDALINGLTDIWMFNCGRRPAFVTERTIYQIIENRYRWCSRG